MFEQLLLALKNRVWPEFTVLNVFFILQNFEQLALALKKRVCPENFHSIEYSFYIQDFWATWSCPEKQSVPWIHCIEYIFLSFRILNKPALALKNRICPEIFHRIEIFFIFQYFWATWSCPENRVCPEFFKLGVGRPPPTSYATAGNDSFTGKAFRTVPAYFHLCSYEIFNDSL